MCAGKRVSARPFAGLRESDAEPLRDLWPSGISDREFPSDSDEQCGSPSMWLLESPWSCPEAEYFVARLSDAIHRAQTGGSGSGGRTQSAAHPDR